MLLDVYSSEKSINTSLIKQVANYQQRVVADSMVTLGFVDITKQQKIKLTELDLQAARNNSTIKSLSSQRAILSSSVALLLVTLFIVR